MSDVMITQEAPALAVPSRRRWPVRMAVVCAAVVVPLLWWAGSTDPLVPGSGGYGVVSDVAPVAAVRAPFGGDTDYVATYVDGARVTLLFPLTNAGPVPVRVTDIFPAELRLACGWAADSVQTSVSTAADYRPFQPFWLSPDEIVDVSVSGRFDCEGRTGAIQGITSLASAPVEWRTAGLLPRTSSVPMGYGFGWAEDPEPMLSNVLSRNAASRTP